MPSLNDVTAGSSADSSCIQQVIDAWKGTVGKGVPLSVTAVNDSANWAVDAKNQDGTNSRSFRVRKSDDTVLIQADINGVTLNQVSISSGTIAGSTLTSPVINGAVSGTAGFGAWSTFTPTLTENSSVPGFTVTRASYSRVGKTADVSVLLSLTSTGAVGSAGTIIVGALPLAPAANMVNGAVAVGSFLYQRVGTQLYKGVCVFSSSNTVNFVSDSTAGNITSYLGATPSFVVANTDTLGLNLHYETT